MHFAAALRPIGRRPSSCRLRLRPMMLFLRPTRAGTLTAALEAERALLSAQLAKAQAHGTAQIAAASLAFTTGRLSSSDVVDPQRVRRH
jgi:hypothetical protein